MKHFTSNVYLLLLLKVSLTPNIPELIWAGFNRLNKTNYKVNLSKTKNSSVFSVSIDVLTNVTIGAKNITRRSAKEYPRQVNKLHFSIKKKKHKKQPSLFMFFNDKLNSLWIRIKHMNWNRNVNFRSQCIACPLFYDLTHREFKPSHAHPSVPHTQATLCPKENCGFSRCYSDPISLKIMEKGNFWRISVITSKMPGSLTNYPP